VTRELIDEVLQLTHPDRHAPEQQALATKVTAALTVLRPFVRSVPKVEAPAIVTPLRPNAPDAAAEPFRISYLCRSCYGLAPMYYCDDCKRQWIARQQQERDAENARRRQRRAEKRRRWRQTCIVCSETFYGKRRDAKTCSARCRIRLHRTRKT
jgi:hypothetical protein